MSNKVTQLYKKVQGIWDSKNEILKHIIDETNFKPNKLIFNGKILSDMSKVVTLVWEGIYDNKPAVLKVSSLNHKHPEPEILQSFKSQNKSSVIRLPELYFYKPYSKSEGYYYYIMEKIEGKKLYDLPIPDDKNNNKFLKVLTEYYVNARNKPLFPPEPIETNTKVFILQRLFKWFDIAQDKYPITKREVEIINKFTTINEKFLSKLPMSFEHRLARLQDIMEITDKTSGQKQYIMFSTAFWSYVPKYYSLTFHLWSAIENTYKLPEFPNVPVKQLIDFIDTWLNLYLKADIPDIKKEKDFPKYFYALMLERATGSIIIDLRVRKERKGKDDFGNAYDYMYKAWHQIWEYCYKKIIG